MRKERRNIPLADILPNTGQAEWLPANPRQWTAQDINRTARSIKEDTDFLEERPILVFPLDDKFIAFAGNLRREGCIKNKMATAPCVIHYPENEADQETIKRRAIKDNGTFGSWDFDALANEWDGPLTDWGVPVWDTEAARQMDSGGLSTDGKEGAEGYADFVNKFDKEIPLTTDDCYTPPEVYDLVRDFVDKKVAPLAGRKIVRPFFPGGDYEDLKQYPKGCVVLDNPPFSIFSKIVRFYLENKIDFFLFGPLLTLCSSFFDGVCYCVFSVPIRYENGALVNTGFVTNLKPGTRIWIDPDLRDAVRKAQENEPSTPVYDYPANLVTAARLNKVANCGALEISDAESEYIRNLENNKELGKGLYGAGFLISTAAAQRLEQAAEKARQAAEKARAVRIELSPREREIVARLDSNEK